MSRGAHTGFRRDHARLGCLAAWAVAGLVVASCAIPWQAEPAQATYADASSPVTDAVADAFQQRIESSAAAYNEATARVEELEEQARECEGRIAELEEQLPAAQDAAADAMRSHYKYSCNGSGLIELVVSADDFSSFISMVAYLNSVEDYNTARIDALAALKTELDEQNELLAASLEQARQEKSAAEEALAEAIEARREAQRRAAEAARLAAEAAARDAARASSTTATPAAETAATPASADGTADAQQPVVTEPSDAPAVDEAADASQSEPAPQEPAYEEPVYEEPVYEEPVYEEPSDGVDWTDERSAFIAQWAGRIDAYLAGSPLGGYGSTFAAAAWDYGVDPRWSPAISCIESSKGAACFLPHNAWGWGSSSWGSWEEAIYAHVAGLARGYGYTLTYEAAQRYCPPTADDWYNDCLAQMSMI